MTVTKVIISFVYQRYDTDTKQFVSQKIRESDDQFWELENGNPTDAPMDSDGKEPHLKLELVQPVQKTEFE